MPFCTVLLTAPSGFVVIIQCQVRRIHNIVLRGSPNSRVTRGHLGQVAVHESRATSVQKASSCEATSRARWSIRPKPFCTALNANPADHLLRGWLPYIRKELDLKSLLVSLSHAQLRMLHPVRRLGGFGLDRRIRAEARLDLNPGGSGVTLGKGLAILNGQNLHGIQ